MRCPRAKPADASWRGAAAARARLLPVTLAAMAFVLVSKLDVVSTRVWPAVAALMQARAAEPAARNNQPRPVRPPATPEIDEGERAILLDLRQRREALDAREAALATREATLAAATTRLLARIDEMTTLRRRLEALEAARQSREEANWQGLVRLYEGMKPREAAAILDDLDLAVLLPIVDRMKDLKASAILAAMQPDRARTVTSRLAELRLGRTSPTGAPDGARGPAGPGAASGSGGADGVPATLTRDEAAVPGGRG